MVRRKISTKTRFPSSYIRILKNHQEIEGYRVVDRKDLADEIEVSEDETKMILSKLQAYGLITWHNNLPPFLT